MAAGTAAALVPIRSITRRVEATSPQSLVAAGAQQRVSSAKAGEETVTFIPEGQEEAGDICLRLLSTLKGIQLGKLKDEFGWNVAVGAADGTAVVGEQKTNGSA
ncbi:hypothetical protein CTA2_2417 [Colletotrichum tanaceti]|nr:hypothetical protein CTA2_2417 [Colletotrichum tanaceti]